MKEYIVKVYDDRVDWYNQEGELHRFDGAAREWNSGTKEWWLNGMHHRVGGPAIEYATGDKEWWFKGKRHREDGPAIETDGGIKEWFFNGKRHREDGPACQFPDGTEEYYIDGRGITKRQFEDNFLNKKTTKTTKTTKTIKTTKSTQQGIRIKDLCKESHDRAVRKGFYDPVPSIESRLCLIHSEVSECLEAYRDDLMTTVLNEKGKLEGLPSELADIIIRVCDFAEHLGIDLEKEIRQKSDYNEGREHKHGRVRL